MNSWQRVMTKSRQTLLKIIGGVRVKSIKGFLSLALVGVSLSVAIASCSAGSNGNNTAGNSTTASPVSAANNKQDVEVTLVSFAVTKAAHDVIIPKFVEKWKQEHNQNVTFRQSYGGSGSQTRAVIDGLEADVVHLALGLDTQKIEKAGLIEPGWEKEVPNNAIASKTVAALITRSGNPKNIKTWADLEKGDIKVITADPKTSGIARWNFLALWNSAIKTGAGEEKALDFVTKIYSNVPILTKDAREATDAFVKQGQGDALINYENEVILAQQKGQKIDYVVPDVNISIDNPIAVVDKNVDKHGTREVAEAFVEYLFTPEAQQEFAKLGFRPLDEAVAQNKELKALADKYTKVNNLGNVQDYGGWAQVQKKFFADGAVFDQIQSNIKR
ncbi:MAG: sulfate ABC transporter substrate-binding protein [Pelatocladus maniniholoensis HA4357-MV3]|jgi:sulfate/thiosulfate-binding protein|uniref:Sulfate ABC transporter substrate-binding protein n=1 Tax=Pelatocladus maniniholoensis HA4357-MV3 TaxID=1117104 RepID=A0A9E3LUU6_9NOST|nr:sulfate ABC transporter substrate-binding protein [Pelatocladus maniniholoensis HA4357-MV3]